MKLNQREQIIVIALAIIIIITAFYLLLLEPQLTALSQVSLQKETTEASYESFKSKMDPKNPIYSQFTIADNTARNDSSQYYPSLLQEKLITILEGYFESSKIQPDSISFDENTKVVAVIEDPNAKLSEVNVLESLKVQYEGSSQENPVPAAVEGTPVAIPAANANAAPAAPAAPQLKAAPLESLERLGAVVTFTSGYEGLSAFVLALESDKRRILIDKITTVRTASNQITSKLELSFYAVPKLHDQDKDYIEWAMGNSYGTDDPYQPYVGFTKQTVSSSTAVPSSSSIKADFFMMLNPIYSDISTVVISKRGDNTSNTYVYADNTGIEDIEFELTQEGDKYFYHYRVKNSSYPKNYADKVEFKPNGSNIVLELFSSLRSKQDDTSGAAITLLNKTKLKLIVSIRGDDPNKPRAQFVKKSGDILIK